MTIFCPFAPNPECEAPTICRRTNVCERRARGRVERDARTEALSRQFWERIAMSRSRGWRR